MTTDLPADRRPIDVPGIVAKGKSPSFVPPQVPGGILRELRRLYYDTAPRPSVRLSHASVRALCLEAKPGRRRRNRGD